MMKPGIHSCSSPHSYFFRSDQFRQHLCPYCKDRVAPYSGRLPSQCHINHRFLSSGATEAFIPIIPAWRIPLTTGHLYCPCKQCQRRSYLHTPIKARVGAGDSQPDYLRRMTTSTACHSDFTEFPNVLGRAIKLNSLAAISEKSVAPKACFRSSIH